MGRRPVKPLVICLLSPPCSGASVSVVGVPRALGRDGSGREPVWRGQNHGSLPTGRDHQGWGRGEPGTLLGMCVWGVHRAPHSPRCLMDTRCPEPKHEHGMAWKGSWRSSLCSGPCRGGVRREGCPWLRLGGASLSLAWPRCAAVTGHGPGTWGSVRPSPLQWCRLWP